MSDTKIHKGRPKGSTNTIKVINDPLIEPFFINVDEDQYTLIKKTGDKEEVYGYFTSLASLLVKLTKYLTLKQPESATLSSYIRDYKETLEQIKTIK
jgi:hypothetical protein